MMVRGNKKIIIFAAIVLAFVCFVVVNMNTFGVRQFANMMKNKGYEFKIESVQKDFLNVPRKRMKIGKDAIDIYVYTTCAGAKIDSMKIDRHGDSYRGLFRGVQVEVDWVAPPHFYRKGRIIVNYVGENQKIIYDLRSIFGKEFAGETI